LNRGLATVGKTAFRRATRDRQLRPGRLDPIPAFAVEQRSWKSGIPMATDALRLDSGARVRPHTDLPNESDTSRIQPFAGTDLYLESTACNLKSAFFGTYRQTKRKRPSEISVRRVGSFPHPTNGCESLGGLLERKDETASTWPFRSNCFGNWLGLHEYWHC
jgi:hypothetical protein